jgi:hypothetical protein
MQQDRLVNSVPPTEQKIQKFLKSNSPRKVPQPEPQTRESKQFQTQRCLSTSVLSQDPVATTASPKFPSPRDERLQKIETLTKNPVPSTTDERLNRIESLTSKATVDSELSSPPKKPPTLESTGSYGSITRKKQELQEEEQKDFVKDIETFENNLKALEGKTVEPVPIGVDPKLYIKQLKVTNKKVSKRE